jgi:tripartite-type tricarboxylate transporter receptor subunit TctC
LIECCVAASVAGSFSAAHRLANEGAEPVLMTPDAFTNFLKSDIAKFGKVVKER